MKCFILPLSLCLTVAANAQTPPPSVALNGDALNNLKPPVHGDPLDETIIYAPEPDFPEIQFFALDPPKTLNEKIEALLYGITIDLPPQYDVYGYEIRRSMAHIGAEKTLSDPKAVHQALLDTQRAGLLLDEWNKKRIEEMRDIEKTLEETGADYTQRSAFKYNRGQVQAFMIETRSWIENNRKLLALLHNAGEEVEYVNGRINFRNPDDLKKFAKTYEARQKSLQQLHTYPLFRMMVY
ncbi:MAG: hypothetical protein ACPGRX_07525 [Bdellovibrionales bacterium]